MGRGRKRKDLPPDDPDQFVQWVQRGRRRWDDEVVPALLSWLLVLERQHVRTRQILAGRSTQLSPAVLEGTLARLDAVIDAIRTMGAAVTQPWRAVDWAWAVAQVTREGRVEEEPDHTPPAP